MELLYEIDFTILNWIQEFIRNDFLDSFFSAITKLGNAGIIWIAIGICLLFFKKYRKAGIFLLAALAVGSLLGEGIIKPLIGRARPFSENKEILLAIAPPSSYSFPSGHSWSSLTAGTFLFLLHKKWGLAALVLGILIAFSRVYLYVHFPSDVITGALCGVATAFLAKYCYDKTAKLPFRKNG